MSEYIRFGKVTTGLMLMVFVSLFLWVRRRIVGGKLKPELRRLVFFDAIEDAVGRATEMNKPVLAQDGGELGSAETASTIAGMSLINYVAKRVAAQGTKFISIANSASILPIMLEGVRQAYVEAGKEDYFKANEEEIVRYATADHTLATYFRERPAAVFLTGPISNQAIWYGEGANRIGAISLGGTSRLVQNPFTTICLDYPLIGEENMVVSAYISRDPISLSTLVVQDYWKVLFVALMFIGIVTVTLGSDIIKTILKY